MLGGIGDSDGDADFEGHAAQSFPDGRMEGLLDCKTEDLMASLATLQDKQLRETKRKLDREILREFMDTNKGPSKFAGKFSAQVPMDGIQWTVPQGVVWMWDRKKEHEDRC